MKLVLDDIVRVCKWLVLRRKRIGGVKELIDSILHDWSVDVLRASASQGKGPTTTPDAKNGRRVTVVSRSGYDHVPCRAQQTETLALARL